MGGEGEAVTTNEGKGDRRRRNRGTRKQGWKTRERRRVQNNERERIDRYNQEGDDDMSLIGRVLREDRERKAAPRKTSVQIVKREDVRVGDWALRTDKELDPRKVAEVDHEREMVRLAIGEIVTDPIPMEYYTYTRVSS